MEAKLRKKVTELSSPVVRMQKEIKSQVLSSKIPMGTFIFINAVENRFTSMRDMYGTRREEEKRNRV